MEKRITRLFEVLDRAIELFGYKDDFLAAKQNGTWIKYSPQQYKEIATHLSLGLLSMGLKPGDKIATITNNRPEWNFIDMGVMQAGMIHVPIYTTITPEEFEHILSHSESELVFVADRALYNKIKPIADKIKRIKNVYTFDEVEGAPNWKEIVELGKKADQDLYNRLNAIKDSIKKDDLATILYTSGTTGLSKGVMLTHWNFIYQMELIPKYVDLTPDDVGLSFLPLSHSLERVVNYAYQYIGVSTYYAESLTKLGDNLREVRPTIFATVPRVLERVYDKILAKGQQLEGTKRKLFFWALDLAKQYDLTGKGILYKTQLALADSIVFSQWRKAVGGRIRYIISGGAKLEPKLARIFWGAGMKILEGYGLTETAPVISVNNPVKGIKIGSVGPKLGDEQQVVLAEDGELLFKGPNLMVGYYKDEEKTREVIDEDGWFHTGDIAKIDEDGFIYIVDRKKEIFKLSNGKYIAPQPIENALQRSPFIEQAFVLGTNQKMPGVIISVSHEALRNWAKQNNVEFTDIAELITRPEVKKLYRNEINEVNKQLGPYERVGVFRLVADQWSPTTGELSPTLKKRRRVLVEKYQDLINEMFAELEREY